MAGTELISEIISILVSGITGIATGVGAGLSELAEAIFFTTTTTGDSSETTLSVLGTCIIVFAGISLAMGLCRWVLNFFTSLGARNR